MPELARIDQNIPCFIQRRVMCTNMVFALFGFNKSMVASINGIEYKHIISMFKGSAINVLFLSSKEAMLNLV